jgi:anti-sigma factor RsiW
VTGELRPATIAVADAHLAVCARCASVLAEKRRLVLAVKAGATAAVTTPVGLRLRVQLRLWSCRGVEPIGTPE